MLHVYTHVLTHVCLHVALFKNANPVSCFLQRDYAIQVGLQGAQVFLQRAQLLLQTAPVVCTQLLHWNVVVAQWNLA